MKLLTWNIQWGRGADGRIDLARMLDDARRFADADVLCLQEVAGYDDALGVPDADQFALLPALLPDFTAIPGVAVDTLARGNRRRRFGNLMLSRLPVLQVMPHLLPSPADAPGLPFMPRVALEVTLEVAAGTMLRVITTHLEYYSAAQRMAQVERLREVHREAVGFAAMDRSRWQEKGPFMGLERARPAVLCGDFNFRPEAAERARLLAPFDDGTPPWRDAWELVHPHTPHPATLGVYDKTQWPDPAYPSDYLFVSADLARAVRAMHVDLATRASDHQPLCITLDIAAIGESEPAGSL